MTLKLEEIEKLDEMFNNHTHIEKWEIVKQYLRARKFEVTEEFVEKVKARFASHQDLAGNYAFRMIAKEAIQVMWEEVENE